MGFMMPHVLILAGAGCSVVAFIVQIIGLATPYWLSASADGITFHSGLWKFVCVNDVCQEPGSDLIPDSIKACRAFGILAVLAIAACVALIALICFMSEQKIFGLLAPAASAAGALCSLIEFAVYAGELGKLPSGFSYNYSFGLTIVAFILGIAATLLLLLGKTRAG